MGPPGPALPVSGWEVVATAAPRGGEGRSRRLARAAAWGRGVVATRVARFLPPVTFGRCGSPAHHAGPRPPPPRWCQPGLLLSARAAAGVTARPRVGAATAARPPWGPLVPGRGRYTPPLPSSAPVRLGPTGDTPRLWGRPPTRAPPQVTREGRRGKPAAAEAGLALPHQPPLPRRQALAEDWSAECRARLLGLGALVPPSPEVRATPGVKPRRAERGGQPGAPRHMGTKRCFGGPAPPIAAGCRIGSGAWF